MKRAGIVLTYPFLWVVVPVLYVADASPGYVEMGDLFIVACALLALAVVVYLLSELALRRRARCPQGLPAFCAMLAVFWLFAFGPLGQRLPRLPHHLAFVLLAIVATVGSLSVCWYIARRPQLLEVIATFLALAGAILALRLAGGILIERWSAHDAIARAPLVTSLARPIAGPRKAPRPARSVYVIVLDEYANADVLHEEFGFDNSAFLDSLRSLGFHIPRSVQSNYAHTVVSIPSLVNAAHVSEVARTLPEGATDSSLLNYLLGHSRAIRFLQTRGYRFVFFPSAWWAATHSSPIADSVVHVWADIGARRVLSSTEFRRVVRRATALDFLYRDEPADSAFVFRTFEGLRRLPSISGPVLAFAHVLSPHWPYVFQQNCALAPRQRRDPKSSYIEQLQCLNGIVLETVGHLIHDSKTPPVILLQGDHGTATDSFWAEPRRVAHVENMTPEAGWERLGAFGAYYLPDGGSAAFGDHVTAVNVLGNVLRYYFGAQLPAETDAQFLSVDASPFHFRRVDPAWLARGRAQAAAGNSH